jgi:hypothetical protein
MNATSASTTKASEPFFDLSTHDNRRRTLRRLLKTVIVLFILYLVVQIFVPLPEYLQQASAQDVKAMPEYRFWTGMTIALVQFLSAIAGVYWLWKYKPMGQLLLTLAVFAPGFLALPLNCVESGAANYLGSLGGLFTGMALFLCWTHPDILDPEPDAATPPTVAPPASPTT